MGPTRDSRDILVLVKVKLVSGAFGARLEVLDKRVTSDIVQAG